MNATRTSGCCNAWRRTLALQHPDVRVAFIFGSWAPQTARPASDIDLMVIGDIGLRGLSHLLAGLAAKIGREINPHVLSAGEFAKRKRTGDHFVSSVLATPRLFVIGSEHELAELAQ